jgi:hypothetical protein
VVACPFAQGAQKEARVKCIRCDADNKLKDRQAGSGRCKGCGHPFAFDPKVMPGVDFTDKFFQHALAALSADGSLFFTPRQFYYFFNQRLDAKRSDRWRLAGLAALIGSGVLTLALFWAGVPFTLLWFAPLLLVAACGVALLASAKLRRRLRGKGPLELHATPDEVAGWYERWRTLNADPNGMLPRLPPAPARRARAVEVSPEVRNYSFDRVVVCERPEIAQCLIANNFHFEHNCAVLSLDGYPHDVFEMVMEMLRRNPALSVYALHDASVPGVRLAHVLRTERRWFGASGASVYDLGLLPRQVFGRPVFVERGPAHTRAAADIPPEVAATLRPEEVRWLEAANQVSLESFPPRTLLRVVAQGIAKSRDPQAGDALAPVSAGGDGGGAMFIYTTDTFG